MNILILCIMVLVNFLIEAVLLPNIPIFGVVGSSSVCLIAALVLQGKKSYASLTGLAMGLINDIIFGPIIGVNGLIFFILGLTFETIDRRGVRDKFSVPIIISMAMIIAYNILYFIIMYFSSYKLDIVYYIRNVALLEIIYTGLLSIPIYRLVSKVFNSPQEMFYRE